MSDREKADWLSQVLGVTLPQADVEEDRSLNEGDATAVRGDSLPQTTVLIESRIGSPLRLVDSKLNLPTARFVGGPPTVIAPKGKPTFQVVESTIGANGGGGFVRYHVEQRRHNTNLKFEWQGSAYKITIEGDGPFDQAGGFRKTSDGGNSYWLFVKDFGPPDDLELRVDIANNTGMPMTLVSSAFEDPSATEFRDAPDAVLQKDETTVIRAQALDKAKPDAAGNVVYRIDAPKAPPRFARMTWRQGARPTGQMTPDDGAFVITSKTTSVGQQHDVDAHQGPPPGPPKPTKVTIVNDAGFVMEQDLLELDNEKSRFLSKPVQTLEGSRKTVFEVESPDPEFPNTSGIVSYRAKILADDRLEEGDVAFNVTLDWRSEPPPSFFRIVPPVEGVSVEISGTAPAITFKVKGPVLGFLPPVRKKQPTLRLGDKSTDGWVEYLQEQLNKQIDAGLTVNGDFDKTVKKKVVAFQRQFKDQGVLDDGIVGDQTWSFLRDGEKEKPKTDGRKPHSFIEKGNEARWVREKAVCRFEAAQDALIMDAVSVGNTDELEKRRVRFLIVGPKKERKVFERVIGPGKPSSTTGQGSEHEVRVDDFATLFDAKATAGKPPSGDYTVQAFFDEELGGDQFKQVLIIP